MKTGEAMEILGLVGTAVAELDAPSVRLAFTHAIKENHPDSTPGASTAACHSMAEIKDARDHLLQVVAEQDSTCPRCNGSGIIPGGMAGRTCPWCSGTGERRQ